MAKAGETTPGESTREQDETAMDAALADILGDEEPEEDLTAGEEEGEERGGRGGRAGGGAREGGARLRVLQRCRRQQRQRVHPEISTPSRNLNGTRETLEGPKRVVLQIHRDLVHRRQVMRHVLERLGCVDELADGG